MPDASIRADIYEPPDVLVYLASEIPLDLKILVHVRPYRTSLSFSEIPNLRMRVYAGLL